MIPQYWLLLRPLQYRFQEDNFDTRTLQTLRPKKSTFGFQAHTVFGAFQDFRPFGHLARKKPDI